jgi:hypothetical protein
MASRTRATKTGKGKAKKLSEAALKIMDENAPEFAAFLYDSTLAGDSKSARMLVNLATDSVERQEAAKNRPFRSVALELAQQPQWTGDEFGPIDEIESTGCHGDEG